MTDLHYYIIYKKKKSVLLMIIKKNILDPFSEPIASQKWI